MTNDKKSHSKNRIKCFFTKSAKYGRKTVKENEGDQS